MKIGIYDSGVGGKALSLAIHQYLPDIEIINFSDSANFPYGSKIPAELLGLAEANLLSMVGAGCDLAVIGCNTLTTNTIHNLREKFDLPIIGVEPGIKPASAITKNKKVAVFATRATLSSPRYRELKQFYGKEIEFVEPESGVWIAKIESGDEDVVDEMIMAAKDADTIVLGCTHFIKIASSLQATTLATMLEPSEGVAKRIRQFIK